MSDRGTFISLEGCEGCGKSTQAKRLSHALKQTGKTVVMTREPGGTPTGEMIRNVLQHHASGEDIAIRTEVMLFAASRAQHVAHVINPALHRGDWVLCDRFVDSSLAYQSGGRGVPLEQVTSVNEIALEGCWPDVTLWFDLPIGEALNRVADRGEQPDRFETEAVAFHQHVANTYAELAEVYPNRIIRVDASGDEDTVFERAWSALSERLGVSA